MCVEKFYKQDFGQVNLLIEKGSYWTQIFHLSLTLSGWRPLSYRNQSIDLRSKSMDWFLYDNDLHHERVKGDFFEKFTDVNFVYFM